MPTEQESYERLQRAIARREAAQQRFLKEREQKNLLKQKGQIEAALSAQGHNAQTQRDKRQQQYEMANTNQRATIAADSDAMQNQYTTQRDQSQQKNLLKRDATQAGYTTERDRRAALDQQLRDERQFGYSTAENKQQHGNTLQRDAIQHGYSTERDEQQFGQQVKRDVMQDQFTTKRDRNQQRDLLQRDEIQFGMESQRDQQQQQNLLERDEIQFGQQEQRDARLQGYDAQNATQRETFEVAGKWQDTIQQQFNAGYDFSEKQKQEMKGMEEALLKAMTNGHFSEDLKQKAQLAYQRKLSAIVPNEKVRKPQDELQQSLLFDERVPGVPFMMGYDSQGRPTFEPIGGSGGKQDDPEKKAEETRQLIRQREQDLRKVRSEVAKEIDPKADPESPDPRMFKTPDEIDNEVLKRFASDELYYTRNGEPGGLPPHEMYQLKAKRDERLRKTPSQYDQQYNQAPQQPDPLAVPRDTTQPVRQPRVPGGAKPPAKPKPVTVSSTNIDDQMKTAMDGGDQESAAALQIIKALTEKYNGAPPEGSEDDMAFMEALAHLQPKGIALQAKPKSKSPRAFEHGYPGM